VLEPIRTLAASWLFAGAVVAFIWAATGLLKNGRKAVLSAYFVAACGVWLISGYCRLGTNLSPYDFFSLLPVPVIYSIGPAIYLWVRDNLTTAEGSGYYHLAWSVVGAGLALSLFLRGPNAAESPELLWIIYFGAKSITMGYLLAILSRMFWLTDVEVRDRYTGLILLCSVALLALFAGLIGSIPGWQILRLVSALTLPGIVIGGFLFGLIHPDLIHSLKEDYQIRYARSRISHLDLDSIETRLDRLMDEERPYLDEDFNLAALSAELDMTPHQVSEMLNSRLGCSFPDFVNGYRIRAALQMLREERDRSILSIGLAVGFNSRSSFHRSFKKHTGKTPRSYREEIMTGSS
tara:strand:+ start:16788 stop:17837 length:1050 start_codon:yes stop_codon:yes gene_type:complete